MIRKQILVCSFLAFFAQPLFAQNDFRDGYIIKSPDDTIFLKVAYRTNAMAFELCRTRNGNSIQEYRPDEIVGYGFVNDKFFRSGIVPAAFAEVLVKGELSLYLHQQAFYFKKGDEVTPIKVTTYRDPTTHNVHKDLRWKGFVRVLIADCIMDQEIVEKLSYRERSLTELTVKYNQCKGSPYTVYKQAIPWTKAEAGIIVGLTNSTLVVSTDTKSPYLKDRYQSINPLVGVMAAFSSPRISTRIALQLEGHLSQAFYTSSNTSEIGGNETYYDAYINVTTVSVPILVRYSLVERKYSIQLNAGVHVESNFKSEARFVREVVLGSDVFTTESTEFGINSGQSGITVGINVLRSFGKFGAGLVVRYSTADTFSNTRLVEITRNRLTTGLLFNLK